MSNGAEPATGGWGLVATCRESEKARAFARRCVTLIILGVIIVHAGILFATVKDFQSNRVPEFWGAVSVEAANMSPQLVLDVRDMANRLYPHYVLVFQKMFERDLPTIQAKAEEEFGLLDAYGKERWPDIEQGIVDLMLTSEEVVRKELEKYVTPEEARDIAAQYAAAAGTKFEDILSNALSGHSEVAREIGENLEKMIETEPDIEQPVDMAEALGILLELAGTEMQKGL